MRTYNLGKPFGKVRNRNYAVYTRVIQGGFTSFMNRTQNVFTSASYSRARDPSCRGGDNTADTTFDVVALDCRIIYTTGGMRGAARVSVIDGAGTGIFDELPMVRTNNGVATARLFSLGCFGETTTRFSGISKEDNQRASLTLPLICQYNSSTHSSIPRPSSLDIH